MSMLILFPKPFLWALRGGSQPLPHQNWHQDLSSWTPRNLSKPWGWVLALSLCCLRMLVGSLQGLGGLGVL